MLVAQQLASGSKVFTCTRSSDIWSFGVLLFELITRRQPYENMPKHLSLGEMSQRILDGVHTIQLTETEASFSQVLADLMNTCLKRDPEERGKMSEHLATLNSYLESLPPTVHDDPTHVAKLEKLYDQKFKLARDKVFAAFNGVFAPPSDLTASGKNLAFALAPNGYKRGSPNWAIFEEARTAGRAVLSYLMNNMVRSRVAPHYLADSGLCRAQNVFGFIMPLEVMNYKIITNADWALSTWADLFAHADPTVVGWQFWDEILSKEGWLQSADRFLDRKPNGDLPTRDDVFSTEDLNFLDSQDQR